ncbi:MAG TPA: hypothetical protein VHD83_08015 [Puia sp.]|nr:hypothetical protein [Puia sp.]
MRWIFFLFSLIILQIHPVKSFAQWKDYKVSPNGDTLNCIDKQDKKQGKWVNHYDEVRGEPGYEEEGIYRNDRKEGTWRLYNLRGDLIGAEFYKWGFKDGVCQYFGMNGTLLREESWKALNPDKEYDTIQVEDIDHLDSYRTVIIKNEGAAIKNGVWKFYDPTTGMIARTETYTLGKKETPKNSGSTTAANAPKANTKPKEVLEFEKKVGKKKVKVQNGSTF